MTAQLGWVIAYVPDVEEFEGGVQRPGERPFNVEIVLVFDDPAPAFARAIENGATSLAEPAQKPWGQVVGYLRDPFGTLVEIASPVP
jgi:lactoylglutathione lyase